MRAPRGVVGVKWPAEVERQEVERAQGDEQQQRGGERVAQRCDAARSERDTHAGKWPRESVKGEGGGAASIAAGAPGLVSAAATASAPGAQFVVPASQSGVICQHGFVPDRPKPRLLPMSRESGLRQWRSNRPSCIRASKHMPTRHSRHATGLPAM